MWVKVHLTWTAKCIGHNQCCVCKCIDVYTICIICVNVNDLHLHNIFSYTYMTPCKFMGSCKCKVKSFKDLRGECGLWFAAILVKLSIAPLLGTSFDHHQSLKLKLPHCHSNYFIGEQGNTTTPWFFFPFASTKNEKMRKKRPMQNSSTPILPMCDLAPGHCLVQVARAWSGMHWPHHQLSKWARPVPPPPLWFFHFCVCTLWVMFVLTSPLSLKGGEQDLPTPLAFGCFVYVLAFLVALPLCIVLCKLQQHKEECVNHRHHL